MVARSGIYISLLCVLAIGMAIMARPSVGAEPVPDENGVMMYNYGGSIGTVYNPKVVAQQGIQNYESYQLTGEPRARQAFERR